MINLARARYADMMAVVAGVQQGLEAKFWERVRAAKPADAADVAALAARAHGQAEDVLAAFWALPDQLMEQFADGYMNDAEPMGYPDAWLAKVGWPEGPPPPPKDPKLPHCCQPTFRGGQPFSAAVVEAR